MRILMVAEKEGTAIHRLCLQQAAASPWHAYKVITVHPKRPNEKQLNDFSEGMQWCDVIDFRYWKTAELLQELHDIKKPALLTHYNPYDINKSMWTRYKKNVVVNETQKKEINVPAVYIPLTVDLAYWNDTGYKEYKKEYDIIMVSNRIEGKKGVLPVAAVASQLGLKMALVGEISDPNYFQKIMDRAGANVDFYHKISDEELRDLYHKSRIHVSNSIDNYESGTLPMLEAMACGVPVITRKTGHVPELYNGRNLMVRKLEAESTEELKQMIAEVLENTELQKEMITAAKETIKLRTPAYAARQYSALYHELIQEKELVSVIIPTTAGPEKLAKTLAAVMSQTYGTMEIVISHDGEWDDILKCKLLIDELRNRVNHTLKFYQTTTYTVNDTGDVVKTYGLARARNKAIMEAEGNWLWFVDDRMLPEPQSLQAFYDRRRDNFWLYGIKDGVKKSFVENFSFCKRADLIKIGMFNEQITQYGGMTQDIRTRAERINKMVMEMVSEAEAKTQRGSGSRKKRYIHIANSKLQCYKLYG